MRSIPLMLCALALGALAAHAQWCEGPLGDQFSVTVTDSSVTVFHHGAEYNCCQDSLRTRVELDGDRIVVREYEYPPGGLCACLCCFNLSATVAGLAPGTYQVEAWWLEFWHGGEWRSWSQEVVVPDMGQSGTPAIRTRASSCTGQDDNNPVQLATWASIKALFR